MLTFILNDETKVNSYGFRVPNSGIDLTRFKSNPVMLDAHENSTMTVIGRWDNVRIEGRLLLADAVFDTEDEYSKNIAGKVERGFIKGVSMGLGRMDGTKFYEAPDGNYELAPCELTEASICAIPSNANAIKLYAENGELIPEDQIKLSLSTLSSNFNNQNHNEMNKIILSITALQVLNLSNTEDVNAVAHSIEKATAELIALRAENVQLKEKFNEHTKLQATAVVEKAIVDGKLTADVKESWIAMGIQDLASVTKTIDSIPAKTNLSNQVNNPSANGEVKSIEDFMKLSHDEQVSFKESNPDVYKRLFV